MDTGGWLGAPILDCTRIGDRSDGGHLISESFTIYVSAACAVSGILPHRVSAEEVAITLCPIVADDVGAGDGAAAAVQRPGWPVCLQFAK